MVEVGDVVFVGRAALGDELHVRQVPAVQAGHLLAVPVPGVEVLGALGEVFGQVRRRGPVSGVDHVGQPGGVQLRRWPEDPDVAEFAGLGLGHPAVQQVLAELPRPGRDRVDLVRFVERGDRGEHVVQLLDEGAEQVPEEPGDRDHHIHPRPGQLLAGDDLPAGQAGTPRRGPAHPDQRHHLGVGLAVGPGRLQTPQHQPDAGRPGAAVAVPVDLDDLGRHLGPSAGGQRAGHLPGVELVEGGPAGQDLGVADGVSPEPGLHVASGQGAMEELPFLVGGEPERQLAGPDDHGPGGLVPGQVRGRGLAGQRHLHQPFGGLVVAGDLGLTEAVDTFGIQPVGGGHQLVPGGQVAHPVADHPGDHVGHLAGVPVAAEDVQPQGDQLGAQPLQLALQLVGVGGQVSPFRALPEVGQLVLAALRGHGVAAPVGGQDLGQLLQLVVQPAGGHDGRLVADQRRVGATPGQQRLGRVAHVVQVDVWDVADHEVGEVVHADRVLLRLQELQRAVGADVDDHVGPPHVLQPGVVGQVLGVRRDGVVVGQGVVHLGGAPRLDAHQHVAVLDVGDQVVPVRIDHGTRPVRWPGPGDLVPRLVVAEVGLGLPVRVGERLHLSEVGGGVDLARHEVGAQPGGGHRLGAVARPVESGQDRGDGFGDVELRGRQQVALPGRVVVSDEADPLVGVRQAPQPQQPPDPPHQPVELLVDDLQFGGVDPVAGVVPGWGHGGDGDLVDRPVELGQHHRDQHLGWPQPVGVVQPLLGGGAGQQDR